MLVKLRWVPLGCGIWSFLCAVGFYLLVVCAELLYLFIKDIDLWFFFSLWYHRLVLVSRWWWVYWLSWEVFPPHQFFGSVWEKVMQILLYIFGRILLWRHLVLDFCLSGGFCFWLFCFFQIVFHIRWWSVQTIHFFLTPFWWSLCH